MAAKKQAGKPSASAAKTGKAKKPAVKAAQKKVAPAKKAPAKAASPAPAKITTPAPAKSAAPVPVKGTAPAPAKSAAPAPAKVSPSAPKSAAAAPKGPKPATASTAEPRKPLGTAAGERADDVDSESLLAGPRNVQPYVPKRGEQYMSKEQLEHFRTILTSWKQDLMLEVDRTVSHMKDEAANFPDPNDRATQEEEFSLELRTRDRERKLIRKIDEALGRIEDGSYGYCLETGEQIGVKRLEARPVATLSLEAQERRERREKQYGDRDDRYR
jgi:DnaK suppressor protein